MVSVGLASHWPCVTDIVVYPPTGSTAYEREMSTPSTLLRSMALFLPYEPDYALAADVVSPLSVPWSYLGHPVKCYKQSPAISAVITEPLPRGVGAVGRTPALKGPLSADCSSANIVNVVRL